MFNLRVTKLIILPAVFLGFFLFPKIVTAAEFEVNNEYKNGIGYTAVLPQDQGNLAIPFKVSSSGNYKNFQFMLQQGYYVGRSFGFPASTPYFEPVSQYPTSQYFDHVKMAVLPSNHPSDGNYPTEVEFANWRFYGDVSKSVATGSKPTLLEPEIIKDSTRYKWLQFSLEPGAILDTDRWYWLVLYTDSVPDKLEEWEFTGMKITTQFFKAPDNSNNFGVAKGWHSQLSWHYLNSGEFIGFRIGSLTPSPITKTPVIIIPGIGGSEFKANEAFTSSVYECGDTSSQPYSYQKDEVIWVNPARAANLGCDDYFDVLKLRSDGFSPEYPQIQLNGTIYSGTYGSLIQFLETQGYELNKSIFVFPYDWRKDLTFTSQPLENLINNIKTQSGKDKVDIIAHSMGGLVARNYIKDSVQASNVRKLVTLGTPYLGAPLIFKFIVYGDFFGDHLGPIGLAPDETKDLVQNLMGGYQLAPSVKYFDFYDGSDTQHLKPFNDQRDVDSNGVVGELDYHQIKQLLQNLGHNSALLTSSEIFHSLDSNLDETNSVEIVQIIGSGHPTVGQLKESYWFNFAGIKLTKKDEIVVNGDGTVPLYSAALTDTSNGKNLAPGVKVLYTHTKHGVLPSSDAIKLYIKNIFNNDDAIPDGIQATPIALEGQQVSVHSPVEIHAYDSVGNHTGPLSNGEFEANIPGSSYDTLVDSKFIWLPKEGNFNIKLEATDNGQFDLKIRKYEDDINTKTQTFQEIPIQETSLGGLLITDNPVLELDKNGDGSVDQSFTVTSVLSEEQVNDNQAPITTISIEGNEGNNDWYRSDVTVTLSATDGNSGVLKTEYSLDGGETSQLYNEPFTISKEGIDNLLVMSTDKAGNTEFPIPQTIKIDKTKPEVNISASPDSLWPPNKKMIEVKIDGSAVDPISGVITKTFQVLDEYHEVEPNLTDFGQTIDLESWRDGRDWDGRVYTIKVTAEDLAGNIKDAEVRVLARHFNK